MGPRINQVIRIKTGDYSGLYRVMATTPEECFLGVITSDGVAVKKRGPKPKQDNNPYKQSTSLVIISNKTIENLIKNRELVESECCLPNHILESIESSEQGGKSKKKAEKSIKERHMENVTIMKEFLNPEHFYNRVTKDRNFGLLISRAVSTGFNKSKVRRLLTQLIRFGLSDKSLIPLIANCGGEGTARPFIEGTSKKPGPKSREFKKALANGLEPPPETPGMSQLWKDKCKIALDIRISFKVHYGR